MTSTHRLRIAVVGAGLSGLTFASRAGAWADVSVFEKSQGLGGRMATRRTPSTAFDHGAQFFTARDRRFQSFLAPHLHAGRVVEWTPRVLTLSPTQKPYRRDWFEPHYVATPSMTALAKAMAVDLDVQRQTKVVHLDHDDNVWFVVDDNDARYGPFDAVVVATPAPQAQALLPQSHRLSSACADVVMQPCIALMLGFADGVPVRWGAATVKDSPIRWMTVEESKPERDGHGLVVHATAEWSQAHFDDDDAAVEAALLAALREVAPDVGPPAVTRLQRWRYADVGTPLVDSVLFDADTQLGVCGDWAHGGRVEGAFLSGWKLADAFHAAHDDVSFRD